MIALLALAFAAGLDRQPAMDAGPREAALLWVVAPIDRGVDGSRLLRVGVRALETRSWMRLMSPEQAGVDPQVLAACSGELRCWTRTAAASGSALRWLYILRYDGEGETGPKVAVSRFDVGRAQERLIEPRDSDAIEDALFRLVRAAPPLELARESERAEAEALGVWLEQNGLVPPLQGFEVEVGAFARGLTVEVDGAAVGVAGEDGARLRGVPEGRRTILLRSERKLRWTCTVVVPSKGPVGAVDCEAGPEPGSGSIGTGLVAAGAVLVALGAAALVAGAVEAGPAVPLCRQDGPCHRLSFAAPGDPGGQGPSTDVSSIRGGGPGYVPVGAGLLGSGAGAMVGGLALEGDNRWWAAAAGTALGLLAAVGLSAVGPP